MPAAGTGQQKGPNSSPQQHPTVSCTTKRWGNWARKFLATHIHSFTWPLTNGLLLLQAFQQLLAAKSLPQSAGFRKYFPRVCWILRHGFLCYRNKQTYLLLAKMCCFYNSYLFNKDAFEPSYILCHFFFFLEANCFTILHWFCHTSTWIHHGCTRVPNPELPSHLPPQLWWFKTHGSKLQLHLHWPNTIL